MTGGSAPSFHGLSVGEALAPDRKDREKIGRGRFSSQISLRKDHHESLGIEEKISQSFLDLSINSIFHPQILMWS